MRITFQPQPEVSKKMIKDENEENMMMKQKKNSLTHTYIEYLLKAKL